MYHIGIEFIEYIKNTELSVQGEAVSVAWRRDLDDLGEVKRRKPRCLSKASWGFSELSHRSS